MRFLRTTFRIFVVLASAGLLASLITGGCRTHASKDIREPVFLQPPCVTTLGTVFRQQGKRPEDYAWLRCTAGAHRGASTEHLENTQAALIAADQDDRYAFIEFDVQYSKDGRIVVFHDKRLLRLFGSLRTVENSTYAELKEVSKGEIVAYDEVIGILQKKLNIEIKSRGLLEEDQRLADELVRDLTCRGRLGDVMISSISEDVVRYVSQTYPNLKTGQIFWLTSSTYLHLDLLTENLYKAIHETQADYLMMHIVNLRNIEDLLRLKPPDKTVIFWDFDDRMFLVHKDLGDRIWGDSDRAVAWSWLRYQLAEPNL